MLYSLSPLWRNAFCLFQHKCALCLHLQVVSADTAQPLGACLCFLLSLLPDSGTVALCGLASQASGSLLPVSKPPTNH